MDLDLRKLRYFTAVAEHQHFGRAAESLYIAQPVLSRQIRSLERELGCALLERTTRSVQLTAAGQQLFTDATALLSSAAAATRRTHEAARGIRRLMIGFVPGLQVSPAVRAFHSDHPDVEVELLRLDWFEQSEALRDGRVDVGYLRRPFDDTDLRTYPVGSEPRVVVLPRDHPLAGRRRLRMAALAGETVLDPARRRTANMEEKLELVASGEGLALLPRSVARFYSRPDLVHRVIADAETHELCLAVVDRPARSVEHDFLAIARATLG